MTSLKFGKRKEHGRRREIITFSLLGSPVRELLSLGMKVVLPYEEQCSILERASSG